MKHRAALPLFAALFVACGTTVEREPLAVLGSHDASEASISRSSFNAFSCDLCHAARPADVGVRILPGAVLQGVTLRPSYWGGETDSLGEAVARCWTDFMRGQSQDLNGPTGLALNAWMLALSTGVTADGGGAGAVPNTWPSSIVDIAPGDAANGNEVYHHACASCHGELNTGPVLGTLTAYIPADTIRAHATSGMCGGAMLDCNVYVREIIIEKVRHGSFLGYDGNMPPFSMEVLSDSQLADIIGYMNLAQYNLPP